MELISGETSNGNAREERANAGKKKKEQPAAWFDDFFTIDPALLDEAALEEKKSKESQENNIINLNSIVGGDGESRSDSEKKKHQHSHGATSVLTIPAVAPSVDIFVAMESKSSAYVADLVKRNPYLAVSRSKGGYSAIYVAASKGLTDAVTSLVDAGAPIDERGDNGFTPLMAASVGGHCASVIALLSAKGDANLKNKSGGTALMAAAFNGHLDCLNALLTYPSIELNAVQENGKSALYYAAREGHFPCVRALVKANANILHRDKRGRTALDVTKDAEIRSYLESVSGTLGAAAGNLSPIEEGEGEEQEEKDEIVMLSERRKKEKKEEEKQEEQNNVMSLPEISLSTRQLLTELMARSRDVNDDDDMDENEGGIAAAKQTRRELSSSAATESDTSDSTKEMKRTLRLAGICDVIMEGATGPRAWKINGTYKPSATELIGGWPVYYRMGQVGKLALQVGATSAVTCLAYHVASDCWLVQSVKEMEKRSDKCYARAQCPPSLEAGAGAEGGIFTANGDSTVTGTLRHLFGLQNGYSGRSKRRSLGRHEFLSAGCLPHRLGGGRVPRVAVTTTGTASHGDRGSRPAASVQKQSRSGNDSVSGKGSGKSRSDLIPDFNAATSAAVHNESYSGNSNIAGNSKDAEEATATKEAAGDIGGSGIDSDSDSIWEVKVGVMLTFFEKQPQLQCREITSPNNDSHSLSDGKDPGDTMKKASGDNKSGPNVRTDTTDTDTSSAGNSSKERRGGVVVRRRTTSEAEQLSQLKVEDITALLQFVPSALQLSAHLMKTIEVHETLLNTLLQRDAECPRLVWMYPKKCSRMQWLRNPAKCLFNDTMMLVVVCPVTMGWVRCGPEGLGWEVTNPKQWVTKWGPAILISIRVMQLALVAGRVLGIPLPMMPTLDEMGLGGIVEGAASFTPQSAVSSSLTKMYESVSQQVSDAGGDALTTSLSEMTTAEIGAACVGGAVAVAAGTMVGIAAAEEKNRRLLHSQALSRESYHSIHQFLTTGENASLGLLEHQLDGVMKKVFSPHTGAVEWVSVGAVDQWLEMQRNKKFEQQGKSSNISGGGGVGGTRAGGSAGSAIAAAMSGPLSPQGMRQSQAPPFPMPSSPSFAAATSRRMSATDSAGTYQESATATPLTDDESMEFHQNSHPPERLLTTTRATPLTIDCGSSSNDYAAGSMIPTRTAGAAEAPGAAISSLEVSHSNAVLGRRFPPPARSISSRFAFATTTTATGTSSITSPPGMMPAYAPFSPSTATAAVKPFGSATKKWIRSSAAATLEKFLMRQADSEYGSPGDLPQAPSTRNLFSRLTSSEASPADLPQGPSTRNLFSRLTSSEAPPMSPTNPNPNPNPTTRLTMLLKSQQPSRRRCSDTTGTIYLDGGNSTTVAPLLSSRRMSSVDPVPVPISDRPGYSSSQYRRASEPSNNSANSTNGAYSLNATSVDTTTPLSSFTSNRSISKRAFFPHSNSLIERQRSDNMVATAAVASTADAAAGGGGAGEDDKDDNGAEADGLQASPRPVLLDSESSPRNTGNAATETEIETETDPLSPSRRGSELRKLPRMPALTAFGFKSIRRSMDCGDDVSVSQVDELPETARHGRRRESFYGKSKEEEQQPQQQAQEQQLQQHPHHHHHNDADGADTGGRGGELPHGGDLKLDLSTITRQQSQSLSLPQDTSVSDASNDAVSASVIASNNRRGSASEISIRDLKSPKSSSSRRSSEPFPNATVGAGASSGGVLSSGGVPEPTRKALLKSTAAAAVRVKSRRVSSTTGGNNNDNQGRSCVPRQISMSMQLWLQVELNSKHLSDAEVELICEALADDSVTTKDVFLSLPTEEITHEYLLKLGLTSTGLRQHLINLHRSHQKAAAAAAAASASFSSSTGGTGGAATAVMLPAGTAMISVEDFEEMRREIARLKVALSRAESKYNQQQGAPSNDLSVTVGGGGGGAGGSQALAQMQVQRKNRSQSGANSTSGAADDDVEKLTARFEQLESRQAYDHQHLQVLTGVLLEKEEKEEEGKEKEKEKGEGKAVGKCEEVAVRRMSGKKKSFRREREQPLKSPTE